MIEELLALAERVEKATGPDMKLDAEIFRDLGIVPDRGDVGYPHYRYTASLDAAMTLVPDRYDAHLYCCGDGEASAIVTTRKTVGQPRLFAATPALALCAAALRARAHQ
jgi:hypothetical protein